MIANATEVVGGTIVSLVGSPDCRIKGNVSIDNGELIYHLPGQRYYDQTRIRSEYGERWFCTKPKRVPLVGEKAACDTSLAAPQRHLKLYQDFEPAGSRLVFQHRRKSPVVVEAAASNALLARHYRAIRMTPEALLVSTETDTGMS